MSIKYQIAVINTRIAELNAKIANAVKDPTFDPIVLQRLRQQCAAYSLELPRLRKQEWEETHESLGFGDDQ